MTIERDAIFLAGFIVGTYDLRGDAAPPAYIQPFIERILNPSNSTPLQISPPATASATLYHIADVCKVIAPATSAEFSDDDKIAAYIEKNPVVKIKRTHQMSPENKEKAAQRMRDMQARKKAEKEAARVTITVEGEPIEQGQVEDWRSRPEPEIHERPEGSNKLGEYFQNRIDTPPETLIEKHNELAGKRDDGELVDEDWGDIKPLCRRGRNHRQIASDYGIDPATMKEFIDRMLIADARRLYGKEK